MHNIEELTALMNNKVDVHKLTLTDIGKTLILADYYMPEPRFTELLKVIKSENTAISDQCLKNTKFLLKLSRYVFSTSKNEDVFLPLRYFLDKFLDKNFDYKKTYNWHELKSVLWYCSFMSRAQNFDEFAKLLKSRFFFQSIAKYLVKDSCKYSTKVELIKSKKTLSEQMVLHF